MKVTIVGNIFGSSGYANHTKQLVNALHEQGVDVHLISPKTNGWEALVNDAELLMLNKPFEEERSLVMIDLPPRWPLELAHNPVHFIGFLVWEGKYIPKYWLKYMNNPRVDQIWVPSAHVLEACRNSGYTRDNIFIVPHGVDLSLFTPQPKLEVDKDYFVFTANKGWAHGELDRGGVQHLIKTYLKEFNNGEKVRLRLKVNSAYFSQGWDLQTELNKLKIENADNKNPEMFINTAMFYLHDMPSCYKGDCFISTTMCDGFNLPGLEAKACGLPTIQTGFGGQTDYMTKQSDIKLDYSLVDVTTWGDALHEGNFWALPSEDDIRKQMRWAFENKDKIKEMGKTALTDAMNWSWRNSAQIAIDALKKL